MESSDKEDRGAFDIFGAVGDQTYPSDDENFILSKRARLLLEQCSKVSDDDGDDVDKHDDTDPFDDDDAGEYNVNNISTLAEDQFETDQSDAEPDNGSDAFESEDECLDADVFDDDGNDSSTDAQHDSNELPEKSKTKGKKKRAVWLDDAPTSVVTKRKSVDIVKARPGPTPRGRRAKSELEAFSLFMSNEIISMIVISTNVQLNKLRKEGKNPPKFDLTDAMEIRCYIGLLLFRGLHRDIKNPTKELWYDTDGYRPLYRACMSRDRFQVLLACLSFHDHNAIRREFASDRFARARRFLDEFENNCRKSYQHNALVCLDETLRNHFSTTNCDFLVFMPDKPGQMGLFFYTLGDGVDRYFSRIIPKVKTAMTEREKKQNNYDIVMKITEDIVGTGLHLTADRGFSSVEIAEELYKKKITYLGTIMSNRTGLPTRALDKNTLKAREINSTVFMWKKDSPVMFLSYVPKKHKNVLLISTEHTQPTISTDYRLKPEAVLFYNEQRCAVDVVNHMVKDCSSQSKTDSWAFAVFTFLIDLAGINAQTILKHNLKKTKINRRAFLTSLIYQLVLPWIKKRYSIATTIKMRSETKAAVISILRRFDPTFKEEEERTIPPPTTEGKCRICVEQLDSLKGKESQKTK